MAGALLLAYAAAIAFLIFTAHGLNDYQGRPLGSDFSNIYAAGWQANAGHASDIYSPAKHLAAERAIFGARTPFYGWHYPPFLLIAAPLALLPYLAALLVWQGVTFAAYLAAMRALLRRYAPELKDRSWILLAIAFPAVFANLLAGHNGFLTAALLAGALAALDTQPLIAGLLFGLLAYKPQFGLMIPLVLLVTQRWRAIAGATCAVIALSLLCAACFRRGDRLLNKEFPHRGSRTGQYRLLQNPERVRLGAVVGRIDPARLCVSGRGHAGHVLLHCSGSGAARHPARSRARRCASPPFSRRPIASITI